ncbi:MAG: fibronectin type domain protein [Candidatus Saccharibacteria bacterium]|nr:fibronectin type domain protein [Candidatus Saccharibacteria bacterium]
MILDTTSKTIEVVLTAAPAANQLPIFATYADMTSSTFVPASSDTITTGTTAVTVVAAPAASTQRQVKSMTIYNADTAAATVTVRLKNSATVRIMVSVALQAGHTLQYGENSWTVINSVGNILQASQISAAGADKEIQFNDGGTGLAGDTNLQWDKSTQTVTLNGTTPSIDIKGVTTSPTGTSAGWTTIFAKTNANRTFLAQAGASGMETTSLQPLLARNKIGYFNPSGNSNAVPGVFGFLALTIAGTLTARTVAVTNLAQRMRRLGFVTAATAGSLAEGRMSVGQFTCGTGAATGDGSGFYYVVRWVPSDAAAVSGERSFVGLSSSTSAATNVEPSTLLNQIGVAQLSTDATQLYLVYGGSTAQTSIALGAANFPAGTLSTTAYELAIFAPCQTANTYYYQVTNISTGATTSGTLTGAATVVPQSSTLLLHKNWITNNATALACGQDICSIYIETDT